MNRRMIHLTTIVLILSLTSACRGLQVFGVEVFPPAEGETTLTPEQPAATSAAAETPPTAALPPTSPPPTATTVPIYCAGVQINAITLDLLGLPYIWGANCVPPTPYDNSQTGVTGQPPTGLPEHVELNFTATAADATLATPSGSASPIVYIIPVVEYENTWTAAGDQSVTANIQRLQEMLQNRPQTLPTSGMPALPFEYASGTNDLAAQGVYLETSVGYGIRFVGRFVQNSTVVTNQGLYYVFQGFTADGQRLISFFYPVRTDKLPDTPDKAPTADVQLLSSNPQAYLEQKARELNALLPSEWAPDLAILDQAITSLNFPIQVVGEDQLGTPPEEAISDVLWQWTSLIASEPLTQTVVPEPFKYTLIFRIDGTINLQADCNTASGNYVIQGSSMILVIGPTTLAACPPGSLSDQYLSLLSQVNAYRLEGGQLILLLANNAGEMQFDDGGEVLEVPIPAPNTPYAVAATAVNVRSGPSTDFPSYGAAQPGQSAEVLGKSQDAAWWVVRLPTTVSPEGQGWVSAAYVNAYNIDNVPVVQAPPLPPEVAAPTPPPGVVTVVTTEPLNVRAGPGNEFPSYGMVPRGFVFQAVGRSSNGRWVAVNVPTTFSPTGIGWVNAAYLQPFDPTQIPFL